MRRFPFVLFAGILVTACALPERSSFPRKQEPSSSSGATLSSSSLPSSARLEGEETGERAPTTEEATGTGSLSERILPTGLLEIGNADAPLTLVVFTEHHCSYCRQFLTEIFPRLKTEYVEKGMLKLQIAMLTLKKYPGSSDAALGFLCAAEQGKGLLMHSTLFGNLNKSGEAILSYAKELKLDMKPFTDCVQGSQAIALLNAQEGWAQTLGISVVPTFFLNGEKFIGLPYYPDLQGRIEEELKAARGE